MEDELKLIISTIEDSGFKVSTKMLPKITERNAVLRYIGSDLDIEARDAYKTKHNFEVWLVEDDIVDLVTKLNKVMKNMLNNFTEKGYRMVLGNVKTNNQGNLYYVTLPIEYTTFLHRGD